MLREHQVHFLLNHCETLVGHELSQIRGKLKSKTQARHAIWELILLDSASAVAPVAYEPLQGEKSPDIFLDVGGGIWLEAAYLEPRLQNAEARKEAFKRYARAVLRKHPEGNNIDCELYGVKTAFGYDYSGAQVRLARNRCSRPSILAVACSVGLTFSR